MAKWTLSLLLECQGISKRESSHDSIGATAVPLTTTNVNECKPQTSDRNRNKFAFLLLEKGDGPCSFHDQPCHVTLDTACRWTLPCELVNRIRSDKFSIRAEFVVGKEGGGQKLDRRRRLPCLHGRFAGFVDL